MRGRGWASGPGGWGTGGGMGMRRHGRGGPAFMLLGLVNNPMMRQRVGITPEQAAKIRQQASDFLKSEIRGRANLVIQRIDLRNLLAAEHPARAAIDTVLQQISALQLAQAKSSIDFRLAMRDAFTPEQRQKLMQMRHDFMRRGLGRRPMAGPRGPQQGMGKPGPSQNPNPPSQN